MAGWGEQCRTHAGNSSLLPKTQFLLYQNRIWGIQSGMCRRGSAINKFMEVSDNPTAFHFSDMYIYTQSAVLQWITSIEILWPVARLRSKWEFWNSSAKQVLRRLLNSRFLFIFLSCTLQKHPRYCRRFLRSTTATITTNPCAINEFHRLSHTTAA
jgi:hypothetical protein